MVSIQRHVENHDGGPSRYPTAGSPPWADPGNHDAEVYDLDRTTDLTRSPPSPVGRGVGC